MARKREIYKDVKKPDLTTVFKVVRRERGKLYSVLMRTPGWEVEYFPQFSAFPCQKSKLFAYSQLYVAQNFKISMRVFNDLFYDLANIEIWKAEGTDVEHAGGVAMFHLDADTYYPLFWNDRLSFPKDLQFPATQTVFCSSIKLLEKIE